MKTYKFKVLIISLAISLSCPAQKNEAQNHIQQLSSPKMYGRGYVNNGIGIAANYIDSCFTSYQLQKFKKLNNYAQSIIYDVNTFPQKMELLLNDSSLIPGIDYIIEPHSKAINGSFNCITFTKKDFENIDNFKARIPECRLSGYR